MSFDALYRLDSIKKNRLSKPNQQSNSLPIKLAATLLAASFAFNVNATTGLTPNTPFEIDDNPESTSGVEFDFLNQAGTALGGYPSGVFMGTPYSGTDDGTFLVIDGGDASCNGTPGAGVVDTTAVINSINFNDPAWPAANIGTGGVSNKTELCSIYVATETIQNGTEFENMLYLGGYFEPGVSGNRGYSIPLFDTFNGTSPVTDDCIIDFRVGTTSITAVEYTCYTTGTGWAPVATNAGAFDCTLIRPDGFFECAVNLDQLGVIPQDECVAIEVGSILSRASGSSYNTQLEDVVIEPTGGLVIENCGSIGITKVTDFVANDPVPALPPEDFSYTFNNLDNSPLHDATLITLANDDQAGFIVIGDTFEMVPLPGTSPEQCWENVIASPDITVTETLIPADWLLDTIECTYTDIFDNDAVKTATLIASGGVAGPDALTGVPVPPRDAAKTSCVITNIDDDITPVTLSSFSSTRSGNYVDIDWGTSSELFNVGFQLWGLDGTDGNWSKLHNWIVRSGSGNAVEPQSYSKRVRVPSSIDQLISVGISSVDSDGSEHYYGPFDVGQAYGDLGSLEPIAWNDVRAELDARMAAAGYVKDRVNGYRKVNVSGALALSASTDSVVEFSVSADGLYRITAQELAVAQIDLSDALKRDIALIDAAGEPVVRYVKSPRTFGTSGEIYFYGNAPDAQAGLYTDQQSYRLVLDSNRALNAPIQAKSGVTSGFSPRYAETSVVENDLQYILTSAADDPWLSAVVTSEAGKPRLYGLSVPVEADADLSQPMVLHMSLGKSSDLPGVGDEHMVRGVVLSPAGENGVLSLGSQTSNDTGLWEVDIEVPGNTPLTLDSNGHPVVGGEFSPGSGYGFSEIHIDSIGLSYARPYEAKGDDNHLEFNSPNAGELGYEVVVPDLGLPWVFASDGGNLVRLLLESAPRSTDAAGNRIRTVRFGALLGQDSALASSPLRYWVGARDQVSSVTGLSQREIASQDSLLTQALGSNYLLIAHPMFIDEEGVVGPLTDYAGHKQGQGYNPSIINYLEVVDAYGGGQAGPAGLTAYLNALEAQGAGIDHVLLVGGSTYDHTGNGNSGALTFIPGHYGQSNYSQFTVSDAPYVMDGDDAFANIGRWPVRSMADLQVIVDKSILWANTDHSSGEALLIAEHTVDGENIDFAAALDGVADSLPAAYSQSKVYVDEIMVGDPEDPTDDVPLTQALAQAKGEIISQLNTTPDVVLYNGHASTRQLSNQNLFKSGDISQVTSSGAEVWLPMSCYVTYYESTHVNTMAHQLLFSGNAVNITGAMLLSNQNENLRIGTSILASTMSEGSTIGEAVNHAKAAQNNAQLNINWSLLGDPTSSF